MREGWHKHQCDSCGFVWEHEDDCGGDRVAAHTCICGEEQWLKYFGDCLVRYAGNCRPNLKPVIKAIKILCRRNKKVA